MPKLGERGIAHILVVILLVAGLLGGLYLVQHPTIFKPKAYEPLPPVPTACNARIASISLADPCNEVRNGFRSMEYSCSIGVPAPQPAVCRSMEDWARTAQRGCSSLCPVPSPSGTACQSYPHCSAGYEVDGVTCQCVPSCQPRPACLDASPACLMPEPAGGWCPGVSPTPISTSAPLSYTCNLMNNKIQASFGTTCGDSAYDPVADVNKDRSVTITDFSIFRASSTNEVACQTMNNNTTNPCIP